MKKQTTFTHKIPSAGVYDAFRKKGMVYNAIGERVGLRDFTFEVIPFGLVVVVDGQEPIFILCEVSAELIAELNKFNLTHTQPVQQIKTTAQELDDASYDLMRKLQDRMNSGNFKFNENACIADFCGCTLQFIASQNDPEIPLITVSVGEVFRIDIFKPAMCKILFHAFNLAVYNAKEKKKKEDQSKLNFIKSIKI